jgi:hypothetical protein
MNDFDRLSSDPSRDSSHTSIEYLGTAKGSFLSRTKKSNSSNRMIRTANGQLIHDVHGAASKSTGKRRNRVNKKTGSSDDNWRRHEHSSIQSTAYKGHWGFSSTISNKMSSSKNYSDIQNITPENSGLMPYLAFNLLVFEATSEECQKIIDCLNKRCYHKNDPHICSPNSPCSFIHKRVNNDGTPNYEAGIHVCALDIMLIINGFSPNFNPNSIVIPSWHNDFIEKWNSEYKSKGMPYPISGFDLNILRNINVCNYFNAFKTNLSKGKRLYVISNIFGGDDPSLKHKIKHFCDINIQLIRGHVEYKDEKKAGITSKTKSKNISETTLEAVARFAAIRETAEETDKCIVIPEEMSPRIKVVYDFQQSTKKGGYNRGIIFGFKNLVDMKLLLKTMCIPI